MPKYLPLSLVAAMMRIETEDGEQLIDYEPVLSQLPEFAVPLAELRRYQQRWSHPSLRFLVEDLPTLERDLREVLDDPEQVEKYAALDSHAHLCGSWTLVMRLCEQCAELAAHEPAQGLRVARAALALAREVGSIYLPEERCQLEALTWAHQGNAHRIPGHLRRAAECFEHVHRLRAKAGPLRPGIWAEIDCLEGSLLRDQRRLAEARASLQRSLQQALPAGQPNLRARCLLILASLDYEEGLHDAALEKSRQALDLLDVRRQPHRFIQAAINVANFLARRGDAQAALDQLVRYDSLIQAHGIRSDKVRVTWIRAVALRGLGQVEEAIRQYEQARKGFLTLEIPLDCALVTLELALVYLEQGHTAQVKRLAREILPVFEMEGISREAYVTLELFRQAAIAEQVTLLQLQGWLRRLGAPA